MLNFKGGLAAVVAYFQANPGVVSLIVAQALLVLAHFGMHVTAEQLYAAAAVAIPLVLAYFKGAEKANKAAVAKDAKTKGFVEAIHAIRDAALSVGATDVLNAIKDVQEK